MNVNTIKWISTFFVLTGILIAQFNIYPLYIFIHSIGAIGWVISGYLMKDNSYYCDNCCTVVDSPMYF